MSFVLFGDGPLAAACFERLVKVGRPIAAVVLPPTCAQPQLAALAESAGVEHRPMGEGDGWLGWLRALAAERGITCDFGPLDEVVRQCFRHGVIGAHPGKLPFYRGRDPLPWALINGESEIGLTIQRVDDTIDTGDILLQRSLTIRADEDYGELLGRVTEGLPTLLCEALELLASYSIQAREQSHLEGTFFGPLHDDDRWIDWRADSAQIHDLIRALARPGPGARACLDGREWLVWRARYDAKWPRYRGAPGQVVASTPSGVRVKTGDSTVVLTEVAEADIPDWAFTPSFEIGARFER